MNPDRDDEMIKKISDVQARLDGLEQLCDRVFCSTERYIELLKKHLHMHDTELIDAFERLQNLEIKMFPRLAQDIDELRRVIGDGEDKAHNPLDRRKP